METKTQTESWRDSAELMVTAVNACKAINPDNPINAAKVLTELIDELKTFSHLLPYEIVTILKKATE